jgi:PhnB protein
MPMITVDDVDATRDFYTKKLGFEHQMGVVGKDGNLDFVNVVIGEASVMFARPPEGVDPGTGPRPVDLYINVGNVDAHHDKTKAAGLEVIEELTDQWWGDRTYVIQDLNGYRLWFYQKVGEPAPPEGTKIV